MDITGFLIAIGILALAALIVCELQIHHVL